MNQRGWTENEDMGVLDWLQILLMSGSEVNLLWYQGGSSFNSIVAFDYFVFRFWIVLVGEKAFRTCPDLICIVCWL